MRIFLKIYILASLALSTILSPALFSFIPIVLIIWHLYNWRQPHGHTINLLSDYFMFFAIPVLLMPSIGSFLPLLFTLPILALIHLDLEEVAQSLAPLKARFKRRPTDINLSLAVITIVLLVFSIMLSSITLLLACAIATVYFGTLHAIVLRNMPSKPVEESNVYLRILAGTQEQTKIDLTSRTKVGGLLFVDSPYEWVEVTPEMMPLMNSNERFAIELSVSPKLSGPSTICLTSHALDRWGLIQTYFNIEPIALNVIPRATYAAWMARRYLTETKSGDLPLISETTDMKPVCGLRRGIEYYGNRPYQPGDSLKNIDWKHSFKYNEMITKQFSDLSGQSAIILINLAVGNAEEADKLAHKIITTALSLARGNITGALAAYDHREVKVTTSMLPPQQLVTHSLQIAEDMVTYINPAKYLAIPDVARLRANISRIRFADSDASKKLAELMKMEYESLETSAKLNPATIALTEAIAKSKKQSNVMVVSQRNHDAEALAFGLVNLTNMGRTMISV